MQCWLRYKNSMHTTKIQFFFSKQTYLDIIEALNSTSRYLDDLLNIDNPYFEQMVGQICPTELQ